MEKNDLREKTGFIKSDEAMEILGIGKSAFYKLTMSKKIKIYKPTGKIMYIKWSDLIAFIESGQN